MFLDISDPACLFYAEITSKENSFFHGLQFDDTIKKFANELVKGIAEKKDELDEVIKNKLKNWNFERVAIIDRNILRMGVYEIMFREDIPDSVSINEAIEIAKKYGDQESSRFINGILDKVAKSKL